MEPDCPWLKESPLPSKGLRKYQIGIFAVVAMVLLQYMLDIVRVKDHVGWPDEKADRHDVAITLELGHIKAQGVALDVARTSPKQPVLTWLRWALVTK